MNKILILGDGLLGSELVRLTGWDYISRKKDGFDIDNLSTISKKYDTIINCIAHTDTYSEEKEKHWKVNCVFLKELVQFCNDSKTKLVHISTDFVYAGSKRDASETTIPIHANNWYSYTKLIGDSIVELNSNDYLICRCSHKPTPFPYDNAWVDYFGNFDYVDVIASLISKLILTNATGIYNVGTELKNVFDLAIKTTDVKTSMKPEHVPQNVSMRINKMKDKLWI